MWVSLHSTPEHRGQGRDNRGRGASHSPRWPTSATGEMERQATPVTMAGLGAGRVGRAGTSTRDEALVLAMINGLDVSSLPAIRDWTTTATNKLLRDIRLRGEEIPLERVDRRDSEAGRGCLESGE